MLPEITVDNTTCIGPLDCGACLQTCPMMVFITGPTKVWKFRETDRQDYEVYARYYDQCITCYKCVDTCPVDAITVSVGRDAAAETLEVGAEESAESD